MSYKDFIKIFEAQGQEDGDVMGSFEEVGTNLTRTSRNQTGTKFKS